MGHINMLNKYHWYVIIRHNAVSHGSEKRKVPLLITYAKWC